MQGKPRSRHFSGRGTDRGTGCGEAEELMMWLACSPDDPVLQDRFGGSDLDLLGSRVVSAELQNSIRCDDNEAAEIDHAECRGEHAGRLGFSDRVRRRMQK